MRKSERRRKESNHKKKRLVIMPSLSTLQNETNERIKMQCSYGKSDCSSARLWGLLKKERHRKAGTRSGGVEGEGVRAAEQQQQQGRAGHAVEYSKVREIV